MAESNVASTFFEPLLEAEISSREERSMMSRMAMIAPPAPIPIAVVMDTALLVAAVVIALTDITDI